MAIACKTCSKCKESLPVSSFVKNGQQKTGLHPSCKDCDRERKRQYSYANRERLRLYSKKHYKDNKQEYNERGAIWRKDNPDKTRKHVRNYQCKKTKATPIWFGELDDFILEESFSLADTRENLTGIKWHVDHIVPLQGKEVCGLHVGNNIQVIPASENLSKSNKYDLEVDFGY